jgi:glycosyltransferase involved in cell wall biosynthesis
MDRIAVLIPCYNEEVTIAKVIGDTREQLPDARIYVFDNNSADRTAAIAAACGAIVLREKRQGKGFVVQSMFRKVDAEFYVMVDGDDTYDLSQVTAMLTAVEEEKADMVVGRRLSNYTAASFRPLHVFGNKLVRSLINVLFKANLSDIMSGYRVMNRDFVKNINITSAGFDIETEMSIKALKYHYKIAEVDVAYRERPHGSHSKLNTFRDGFLVLKKIFLIFKDYEPLWFFLAISLFFMIVSLGSGFVVVDEFIRTRYITHVPLAIFASGSMVLSIIFFVTGIITDSVNKRFEEMYHYLRSKK